MCTFEQLKSKVESKNINNSTDKDIQISKTIELVSQITYSSNKINEGNNDDNNIFDKEKPNKNVDKIQTIKEQRNLIKIKFQRSKHLNLIQKTY